MIAPDRPGGNRPGGPPPRQLAFENVTFRYSRRGKDVLAGFSWAIPRGRTVLLGPNGAGKTTLLSIGANAFEPRRGRVVLDGLQPTRRRDRTLYRRAVGWMPQHVHAVPGLTAREQVAYAAWLKGEATGRAWASALDALDRVGLRDLADRKTSSLSGGQLRRVGLAQAIAHASAVLLLDEPTVGLDPAQRIRFREILTGLPRDVPVVASTHQVDDLSEIFDLVAVLIGGRLIFEGAIQEFLSFAPAHAPRPAEAAYAVLVGREA